MSDPTPRPTPRSLLLVGGLALVATVVLGARAAFLDGGATGARLGAWTGADQARALGVIERLGSALVAMQAEDGRFHPPPEAGAGAASRIEALSRTALATAVLARLRALRLPVDVASLDDAIERGLTHVRGELDAQGIVGRVPDTTENRPWRIEATAATLMALATVGDVPSVKAGPQVGAGLAALAEQGLQAGWPRALTAMAVDIAWRTRRQAFLPLKAGGRRVVKGREIGEHRSASDLHLAEAIVRLVRAGGATVDAYPDQILALVRQRPPLWENRASDMQAWWMQGWLVARSGKGPSWFLALLDALEAEGLDPTGRVPGGFYADTLLQTSAALGAMLEGVQMQVTGEEEVTSGA